MTKDADRQKKIADNTSGGGHIGGTHFGQQQDAKTKDTKEGGDKARPNKPKA